MNEERENKENKLYFYQKKYYTYTEWQRIKNDRAKAIVEKMEQKGKKVHEHYLKIIYRRIV